MFAVMIVNYCDLQATFNCLVTAGMERFWNLPEEELKKRKQDRQPATCLSLYRKSIVVRHSAFLKNVSYKAMNYFGLFLHSSDFNLP
jgi:hypothetical protein